MKLLTLHIRKEGELSVLRDSEVLRRDAVIAGADRARTDLIDYHTLQDADEPNRFVREGRGTRRVHFWKQVADCITPVEWMGDRARFTVPHIAYRQKVFGGPIHAKRAPFLTIPVDPDAYARSAAEVNQLYGPLFRFRSKKGNLFLAGKNGKELRPFFLLRTSVNQKPWKTTQPKLKWLKESFRTGIRTFLRGAGLIKR